MAHLTAIAPRTLLLASLILPCCNKDSEAATATPEPTVEPVELTFGAYAADRPDEVVRQFRPLLDAIERDLSASLVRDVVIRMQVAKDYARGISDLVQGSVDFSRFGPVSFVLATEENPQVTLLAKETVRDKEVFFGIICARKGGPIDDIPDLKGRSFAFGSDKSTIGRYLAQRYLSRNGIRAADLSRYEYLGRHDIVGTAVAQGRFDAGALKERTFKKLVAAGEPLVEVARFENVTKPWAGRAGLDPGISAALTNALLDLRAPDALAAIGKSPFVRGSLADYDVTRHAIVNNGRFFEKQD